MKKYHLFAPFPTLPLLPVKEWSGYQPGWEASLVERKQDWSPVLDNSN